VTALFATLLAMPWMLKDSLQFGNPFFPIFNHWFPNPYQYPIVEDALRRLMLHVSGVTLSRIPWEATVGGRLFGVLGPVFLLAPLALLSLRRKPGRLLLFAFVPMFLSFLTNIGDHFLIPSLPFPALALGLLSIPRAGPALAAVTLVLHAGLSWPGFIDSWSPGVQWRIDQTDWRVGLRVVPEARFLAESWRDYKPGLLLNRFVPPGERFIRPTWGRWRISSARCSAPSIPRSDAAPASCSRRRSSQSSDHHGIATSVFPP
jgi:hypothetical protein